MPGDPATAPGVLDQDGGLVPDEKPQIERFKEVAREPECDEDETRFEEALRAIVPDQAGTARAEETNAKAIDAQ
jgi:hypothetical protein